MDPVDGDLSEPMNEKNFELHMLEMEKEETKLG